MSEEGRPLCPEALCVLSMATTKSSQTCPSASTAGLCSSPLELTLTYMTVELAGMSWRAVLAAATQSHTHRSPISPALLPCSPTPHIIPDSPQSHFAILPTFSQTPHSPTLHIPIYPTLTHTHTLIYPTQSHNPHSFTPHVERLRCLHLSFSETQIPILVLYFCS